MSLQVAHAPLPVLGEHDLVLLIVPQAHLRVGRDHLRDGSAAAAAADDDDTIVRAARTAPGDVRVSVFCGSNGDVGSWGFADDLSPDETTTIALREVEAQLQLMRRLFMVGVCMHVRLDLGPREQIALRQGHVELRHRRERDRDFSRDADRELAELDIWLLRDFVFSFAVSVPRLLESTLGANLPAIRARMRSATARREAMSPTAIARIG